MNGSTTLNTRCDVLVVGAGPAGAATALALARRGIGVALLERRAVRARSPGESLSAASRGCLEELGVWDEFSTLEHRPTYLTRSFWGGRQHDADGWRYGLGPDLHVDRARFDAWLTGSASRAGVRVHAPARVQGVTFEHGAYRLSADVAGVSHAFESKYLVDATGRQASLARRFGARRAAVDGLVAIARWCSGPDPEPLILVEPADHGFWYTAPRPEGGVLSLFFTDRSSPLARAARAPIWHEALRTAPRTQARLAGSQSSAVSGFAASPGFTAWDVRDRLLPVGDAALSLDPVAAAGLTLALRSGLEAARAIEAMERGTRNVGLAYREGLRAIFEQHLRARDALYGAEAARHGSAFWNRRPD